MATSSEPSTPKRKHSELANHQDVTPINIPRFSFDIAAPALEDGSSSPRTSVAHKFRGLAIDGGVGHRKQLDDLPDDDDEEEEDMGLVMRRKKMKLPQEVATSLQAADDHQLAGQQTSPAPALTCQLQAPYGGERAGDGDWAKVFQATIDPALESSAQAKNKLQRGYPSINHLQDSKSRRKRCGTPPVVPAKTKVGAEADVQEEPPEIIDPVRAALTWHEDEITIYDPNDEDDDGTGINGIGFKPTPALAYARVAKRKQQLAEYKKREDREARARRSQRRKGRASPSPQAVEPIKNSPPERRVHFMEVDSISIITT